MVWASAGGRVTGDSNGVGEYCRYSDGGIVMVWANTGGRVTGDSNCVGKWCR